MPELLIKLCNMYDSFEEQVFKEINFGKANSRVIKSSEARIIGQTKISVEEEGQHGVKVILKKDADNMIKELKFICTCGQSKSILLEYSDE